MISAKTNIPFLSAGELIRNEITEKSNIGKEMEVYIKQGQLVPDSLVNNIVINALSNLHNTKNEENFIIDGYPRKLEQAKFLSKTKFLPTQVIEIRLDSNVAIEKALSRRHCRTCGYDGFNVAHIVRDGYDIPAILPNKSTCKFGQNCVHDLVKRTDDNIDIMKYQIQSYFEESRPMLKYYNCLNVLKTLPFEKAFPRNLMFHNTY